VSEIALSRVRVDGRVLEVGRYGWLGDAPTLVLLHEALGSVRHWRNFPQLLCRTTNCNALLYSRAGHGHSEGPVDPRSFEYLEYQSSVVLRSLMKGARLHRPVLFGHSEGAAIAMLFASRFPESIRALILESPVVLVEPTTINGVHAARKAWETTDFRERLGRYHRDPEPVFNAFIDPWLANPANTASFRQHLKSITCPTLVLQGDRDEYATSLQTRVLSECLPEAEVAIIPNCGHTPHRERPDLVLDHVARFLFGVWLASVKL
jgi:pimeloyl-ACP methyl ester carboxylesterase